MLLPHRKLQAHHKYQLEVIFLFILGLFLFALYYVLIEDILGLNIHTFQWYFFYPWILFYTGYSLFIRSRIPTKEQQPKNKRHLLYWICLGIALVLWYSSPLSITKPMSIYYMYGVFTLFLADGYWNFR